MDIIIVTQNEPFYLAENLSFLFGNLRDTHHVKGVIVADASPFGKRESFVSKAIKTKKIFGLKFFLFYGFKYVYSKLFKKTIKDILNKFEIEEISISGSINSKENIHKITSYKPDLIISILGNQIFKQPFIDIAPKGCINLHTALLPKYRGLMPTFWVLKNNEKQTGVSVFYVDEGIDSGPIIIQEKVEIKNQTQQQLIKETKKIGMKLILKSIDLIDKNQVKLIDNDDSKKSYYTFPTIEDVYDFKKNGKTFF